MLPIYIDIDGTLTDREGQNALRRYTAPDGFVHKGKPRERMISLVKRLISNGTQVIIWSGGGQDYATAFCAAYEINPHAMLGKPLLCVDDDPDIRPRRRMPILSPLKFMADYDCPY